MIALAPSLSPQWMVSPQNYPVQASSPCFRVSCSGGSPPATDLKFVLHTALDSSGIDTAHAREARRGFMAGIERLTTIERGTSITFSRVNLWKTALYIAAEDDSIVSQSKVPLPVNDFSSKLFPLAMNFCTKYSCSVTRSSPELFLGNLERFLYYDVGFKRSKGDHQIDPQALYLHSVLKKGSGSAAMLALIYAEILKVLRMWCLLNFDSYIFFPLDRYGLPRGCHKRELKDSDQTHIVTTQTLLHEILRNIKETFWPFQHDYSKSPFLRAVDAANCLTSTTESGLWLPSATAATQNRVRYGDMRLALSACERLILMESDPKELRDYSILLYHCGFYDQSLHYLKLYKERQQKISQQRQESCNNTEEDGADRLMTRLNLISMGKGWR